MKRLLCSLVSMATICLASTAQGQAEFVGNWVLDTTGPAAAPQQIGGMTVMSVAVVRLVISAADKGIQIESHNRNAQTGSETISKSAYTLDGSEVSTSSNANINGQVMSLPGSTTSKHPSQGHIEVISTRSLPAPGGEVSAAVVTDSWELTDGGNTLLIHRSTDMMGNTNKSERKYHKAAGQPSS